MNSYRLKEDSGETGHTYCHPTFKHKPPQETQFISKSKHTQTHPYSNWDNKGTRNNKSSSANYQQGHPGRIPIGRGRDRSCGCGRGHGKNSCYQAAPNTYNLREQTKNINNQANDNQT